MAKEDKTEELRQTWKHKKIVFIIPLLLILFYIIFFGLTAADNVPSEEFIQESYAVTQAKQKFIQDLPVESTEPEEIEVVSESPEQWSDGCLGLAEPDEVCTQQIVDGYRVELTYTTGDQTYTGVYRTDEDGGTIRQEQFSVD